MRPIHFVLLGLLGLLIQYGLDLALIRPAPSNDMQLWFLGLESLALITSRVFVLMIILGAIFFVVEWTRKSLNRGRELRTPLTKAEVIYGDSDEEISDGNGLGTWPRLSGSSLKGIEQESKVASGMTFAHTVLRWITGINFWVAIVLTTFVLVWFTFQIVFREGIEVINEWKSGK